ncbi:MAG: LLM class flavin-dependent oxidoreductase [Anaerolineaceae bacterium]|nr:LLM class flavin-dependent oxidoreductase [Anaerolineaceae bacterium]
MKYGVHLPNFGAFGDIHRLLDLARKAEDAGWDGFFLWDHLLFCELDQNAHVDPWMTLAAAAVQTKRIMLGTLVTPLPRRRPWKVARETVTLQNLSGGRLILGVGLGDPVEWEYRTFHEADDPKIRAEKLDEGLAILTNLWQGKPFRFTGQHYQLEDATFLPAPIQPIPVWVGGYWPHKAPFRRAARYDGMFPGVTNAPMTPEQLGDIQAYLQTQRGSSTAPFDLAAGGVTAGGRNDDQDIVAAYERLGATWWIEDISPLRLGMGWGDLWREWDTAPLESRIMAGPPRL